MRYDFGSTPLLSDCYVTPANPLRLPSLRDRDIIVTIIHSNTELCDSTQASQDQEFLWLQSGGDRFTETIVALVNPVIQEANLRVVRVQIIGDSPVTLVLMLDLAAHARRTDQDQVTLTQLSQLSPELSPVLDVANVFSGKWHFELSSPGVERYLSSSQDFARHVSSPVRCRFREPHPQLGNHVCGWLSQCDVSPEMARICLELESAQREDHATDMRVPASSPYIWLDLSELKAVQVRYLQPPKVTKSQSRSRHAKPANRYQHASLNGHAKN